MDATNNTAEVVPFEAIRPTEIVKDELKARNISRKEFAERMGMHPSNISRLLKGEDITMQTAQRLENAIGIPAEEWMRLQAIYERDVINIAKRSDKSRRIA